MCVSKTLSIRKPQSDSRHTNLMTKFINEIFQCTKNIQQKFRKYYSNKTN